MKSSNAISAPGLVLDAPAALAASAAEAPESVDAGAATASPTTASPFQLLPTGEAFGVCDLDGVCS
ncbi:hypothetical protein AB1046_13370 [Promicromonospora sp. Populi]|uniref:hypothetical protein n=1 Tax=Promicromonospora sp. Populi TaxID=3239420 RepID=UPI0034E1A345